MNALAHPGWWLALFALVLNDHVLKRSTLAGWCTGKLSDFAGLIVAPILVAALMRAKTRSARAGAFALVVVPFVAIKVSDSAASMVVHGLSRLGVHWRLWVDPTDLVALSMLPVAWHISAARSVYFARTPFLRIAALLGAVACIATSTEAARYQTAAYLLNLGSADVEVRLYRVATPLDCAAVSPNPRATITADLFAFERCRKVPAASFLPLDVDWVLESDAATKAAPRGCDAVVLRVAGEPDTVVFWNGLSKVVVTTDGGSRVDVKSHIGDPHALFLEQLGDRHVVGATELLHVWPLSGTLPTAPTECPEAP